MLHVAANSLQPGAHEAIRGVAQFNGSTTLGWLRKSGRRQGEEPFKLAKQPQWELTIRILNLAATAGRSNKDREREESGTERERETDRRQTIEPDDS